MSLLISAGFSFAPQLAFAATITIENDDLIPQTAKVDLPTVWNSDQWFFYNDSNDTIMAIDEFAGVNGSNTMIIGPDSIGAAKMKLHDATGRYNIATYKYRDVKLSSIDTLSYRTYDASSSSQTPFLHFNVDFNNSDTWQRRLVQVPTGVTANTWTEIDALTGMWTLSGGNWPVGSTTVTAFAGSTPRPWADIIADYPDAETRSTDAFFGIRVGHPGPSGEESYVDWVNFDGEISDFEPTPIPTIEDTVVVTNSDLKGWTVTTAADGLAQFILNGTAPLGDGNLNMTTTVANEDRVRATKEVSVALADLGDELSYQTRQNESHCDGCSNAAYRIYFDADGNLETAGDTAELVYEPYWQNGKLGDPAPVEPDMWQTWDVDAGFFWAGIPSANQPNLPQLTNGAGGPPFYTLADIESFYPDAVVYAISVGIGTYNPTNDIDVDAVKFSYTDDVSHFITTYDFEPNLAPEAYDMTVLIPFNVAGTFNLAADDAEGDALTAAIVDAPNHGTVETVSGLQVKYTPTFGFFGYDSFTFTVNDGTSGSNVADVDIIVYKDPTCPEGGSFVGGGSGNCMKMVDTIVAGVMVKLPEFYTASCPEGSTLVKPHDACEADGGTPGIPNEVDNTFDIEATAGENGAIAPSGTVAVVSGTDKTFIITPDNGYVVDSVLVDDEPVGAVTEYEFTDVDAEHTIHATFKTAPETPEEEEETSNNNPPRSGGGGGGGGGYVPPVPQVLGASTTNCFQFTRNLSYGMNGADVLELQKALTAKGFMTATPNGNFGPATRAAVIAFQNANGLEQVGSVGPKTRALLNASCTPSANPNQALIDELTKKLQALLAQIQQLLAARTQ